MSKPTVLVVDDEIGIRGLVQAVLEDGDCRAVLAGTPSQALRLAEQDPPDVAILDFMLPEMAGTDLGLKLRERFGDTFPLVFMSAVDIPSSKLAALSSYLFLSKPFDIDNVLEAVRSALAPVQPRPLTISSSPDREESLASEPQRRGAAR
ncbi:MAG TPA: response regulator [Chloroflexota bacterium]|nr:response regulator [Chloroflexota bacterium]